MSSMSLFYYPWYIHDWRKSRTVRLMSWERKGIYREMLDEAWIDEDCSLPDDCEQVSLLIGCRDLDKHWLELRKLFTEKDGRLYSERLSAIRVELTSRREAGRKGGIAKAKNASKTASKSASTPPSKTASKSGSKTHDILNIDPDPDLKLNTNTKSKTNESPPGATRPPKGGSDSQGFIEGTEPPENESSSKQKKKLGLPESDFEKFWVEYPRDNRGPKSKALAAWKKLDPEKLNLEKVLESLNSWKASDRWRRGFVLRADRWLDSEPWESAPSKGLGAFSGDKGIEHDRKEIKRIFGLEE